MSASPIEAVPFPYLADIIRKAKPEHAVQIFKAVTQLTFHVRHLKVLEEGQSNIRHINFLRLKVKRTYSIHNGAKAPLVSSLLDIHHVFNFVYEHADSVQEPPDTMDHVDIENEMTLTEEWLVHCVLHPKAGADEELKRLWSGYILRHILYNTADPVETYYAKRMLRADVEGASLGLQRALQPYVAKELHDADGVYYVLNEFLRLGDTAARVWIHVWRDQGIMRGTTVDVEDHIAQALSMIETYYERRICDEQDTLPLYVRRNLASVHITGEFLVLLNWVFPSIIAPAGSTIRENEFSAAYQRWIVEAATSPEIDPDGRIAEVIRISGLVLPAGWNLPSASDTPMSIIDYSPLENDELGDVKLIPYGRRNKAEDFTDQIVCPPSGMVCTICSEEFGSNADESSCRQLEACQHSFHWECLDGWINASHAEKVRCPNCREPICDARPRRPQVSRT